MLNLSRFYPVWLCKCQNLYYRFCRSENCYCCQVVKHLQSEKTSKVPLTLTQWLFTSLIYSFCQFGLWPKYCYLVGEINLWWWQRIKIRWWWWGSLLRAIFPGGGMSKFLANGGLRQQGNPLNCCATPQLVLPTL